MTTAEEFLPDTINLTTLKQAAHGCRGCHLYENATQVVFGEGLVRSRLMLVGEMPGDQEDLAGKPFVGPAGKILDDALVEAGIDRDDAYVTNVVKHFNGSRGANGGFTVRRTARKSYRASRGYGSSWK